MNYLKKICVFKEIGSGYAYNGKTVSGMLKCELIGDTVNLSLSVGGLAPTKSGEYFLVIGSIKNFETFEISIGETLIKTYRQAVDICSPFCAGIVISEENKLICYTSTPDYKGKYTDIIEFFNRQQEKIKQENIQTEGQIERALKEYVDDTVATENYYENEDVDLKNLSLKESLCDCQTDQNECTENNDSNQEKTEQIQERLCEDDFCEDGQPCFTAMEDVENVLKCFPRFTELENAVYGSVWVTVPLENGEYYFGKTQIGEDKYLCYAVKGTRQQCPAELKELACFVPSAPYLPDEGYFIMFQDAITGKVIKK